MTAVIATSQLAAGFPSPPTHAIDLPGPFQIAFYAVCIIIGAALAVFVTTRLWKSRGGNSDDVFTATLWAVVLGIIGARVYHVMTSPDGYFGEGGDLAQIPQIWNGGLSIIGAVAAGTLGVWIACRQMRIKFGAFADAVVPGLLLAQAVGRWGNWFNQELYGGPTTLPWGLRIDTEIRHQALPTGASESVLFHPTFLYESLWNLLGFVVLLWLFRRFQFRQGMVVLSYAAYYALGRFWIESLRRDEEGKSTQYPLSDLGLDWRLNQIVMLVIFVLAVAGLIYLWSTRPRTDAELDEQLAIYHSDRPELLGEGVSDDADGDAQTAGYSAEPQDPDADPADGGLAPGQSSGGR